MRIGVMKLLQDKAAGGLSWGICNAQISKQFVSITLQVISVWCRW